MKKWILGAAAALALGSLPLIASAQFAKPEDAVRYRQSALNLLGNHFGRLGAMAQGKMPYDAKAVADNLAVVSAVYKLPFTAFTDGTDKVGNTKARPEVWSDRAKFDQARDKMWAAVDNLVTVGKSGQEADIKKAIGETGATCKGCHDDFRSR